MKQIAVVMLLLAGLNLAACRAAEPTAAPAVRTVPLTGVAPRRRPPCMPAGTGVPRRLGAGTAPVSCLPARFSPRRLPPKRRRSVPCLPVRRRSVRCPPPRRRPPRLPPPQLKPQPRCCGGWAATTDAEDARFSEVGGLAAWDDLVYVADAYGGVFMFDLAGEYRGVISAGEIVYITDVKVGPAGDVYIADSGAAPDHPVQRGSRPAGRVRRLRSRRRRVRVERPGRAWPWARTARCLRWIPTWTAVASPSCGCRSSARRASSCAAFRGSPAWIRSEWPPARMAPCSS